MLGKTPLATGSLASPGDTAPPSAAAVPEIVITVGRSACFGLTTAGDVIEAALKAILVQAAEGPLEEDEYSDALDELNDYMADLEGRGVRLGYNKVCNVGEVVTIPDEAIRAVKANLALELAPQFNGSVSPFLIQKAERGLKTLRRISRTPQTLHYPNNLPAGTGNYNDGGAVYSGEYFNKAVYLSMGIAANRIATEITTSQQAEKVSGFWDIADAQGLDVDISGRVTNTGEAKTLTVAGAFTLSGTTTNGLVGIAKNARIQMYSSGAITQTGDAFTLSGEVTLKTGEFLEFVVGDIATTSDITMTDAVVTLET